ncbi:hypothetical protein TI04_06460 [Achromatium sp. WMS2]|nr:hypothetical protein TI04_06460 [Achromatium sp. WMS2]
MSEIIQLVYASRATFESPNRAGIDLNVARILMQSRRNNIKLNLGGVLYYGDSCFFQCLEGEKEPLEATFDIIKHDPRHSDIKVLMRSTVPERTFGVWSMKYVPAQADIKRLLQTKGLERFDPYQFDTATIEQILGILTNAADPTKGASHITHNAILHFLETNKIIASLVGLAIIIGLMVLWWL